MNKPTPTFPLGQRVLVVHSDEFTTETRAYLVGQRGTVVTGESGQEDNGLIAVALDSGIVRTFFPAELVPFEDVPAGFTPAEDMDGEISHFDGPQIEGDGWLIDTMYSIERRSVVFWPVIRGGDEGQDPQLTPSQAFALGQSLIAASRRWILTRHTDGHQFEDAHLGEAFPVADAIGGEL
ncbi:hypothetical protein SCMU_27910 [Sinomonas cyclohexanicum]|uniref:Uncharacterized protein n=1 Tax=Sinomonas cyclohexanicum TaxID=322009 RepID=A0ABM7PXU3_SINCY|nr:hypothetical protein [Corynebacterium cyclohexanicum]BCT76949.1 hypothetical protein SCMU_27910 [Corynebacterium cyclohexanicum]